MESIPFSQLADFLHVETQDANLEKTTMTTVRTRSGDLQLGLGAGFWILILSLIFKRAP